MLASALPIAKICETSLTRTELEVDQFQRIDVFDAIASAGLKLIFRRLTARRYTFHLAPAPARS